MSLAHWAPVVAELDRATDAGEIIRVWLRDDDAVAVTPALEDLDRLCGAAGMPVLLAVIPAGAEAPLGPWVAARPGVTPCQHGYAHANHAPPGERARELGGTRSLAEVLDDLARGRRKLRALFRSRLADILVPPWNRIDPTLVTALPGLGFAALSTAGPAPAENVGIARLNVDLDIMDWRNGRRGRSAAEIAAKLAPLLAAARVRGTAVGLLTHHLAHDAAAWAVLAELLDLLGRHRACRFVSALDLLPGSAGRS